MADRMIFPIGFDLKAAVDGAIKDWDDKEADRLEKAIQKRALEVKLQVKKLDTTSLEEVKKRLGDLKIEPITPETKAAIKELAKELRELANALEAVKKYSARVGGTPEAVRNSKIEVNEQKAAAARELARQRAAKAALAEEKLRQARMKSASAASKAQGATRKLNQEYENQDGYISHLVKKMAVYASFSAVGNLLTNIRDITAEFELQRISLGAIIQDQAKANQLFSEIKQFALKSPVKILDLTKYTKQLAAYKIGFDELFETTKKLTDVSVGLGVSMDRVVLAYGQTRATGHLRASEIRQFTEMGVPIVEELAAKLSKMNGEMVTSAQVMDMVSKRAISFEMVKEVFDDMTSAGGMFYNMQEKQGNTLYGMWAKLGDAASVMYEQIGNTDVAQSVMKGMIGSLTDLMQNWQSAARRIALLGSLLGTYVIRTKSAATNSDLAAKATARQAAASAALTKAKNAESIATNNLAASNTRLNRLRLLGAQISVSAAEASIRASKCFRIAANSTNFWTVAQFRLLGVMNSIKAAMISNWPMIAIAVIVEITSKIIELVKEVNYVNNLIDETEGKTITQQNQSVSRFEELANAAVKSANGSKQQREALEELQRTYRDILPMDALKLENLVKLNGHYETLTKAIREYIAVQQQQTAMNELSEKYGKKITKDSKNLIDEITSVMGIGRDVSAQIVGEMQRDYEAKLKKGEKDTRQTWQRMIDAAKKYGVEMSEGQALSSSRPWWFSYTNTNWAESFYNNLSKLHQGAEDLSNRMKGLSGDYGEFQRTIEKTKESLSNIKYTNPDGTPMNTDTLMYQQSVSNDAMKAAHNLIIDEVNELNKELMSKGEPLFKFLEGDWTHWVGKVDPNNLMDITTINFDAILKAIDGKYPEFQNKILAIQKEWGNVAPTNATAMQIRTKLFQISQSFDPTLQKMKKYLWDGSGEVDAYLKRLKGQQEELKNRIKEKQAALKNMSVISKWWNKLLGKDIEAEISQMNKELAAIDELVPFVQEYAPEEKNKSKGGTKSDPRLQNLKEEISLVQKLYQEYQQLEKQEGASKAASDMERMAKTSIDALSKKYGISLPTTAKDLTSALEILYKKMAALPKKVFPALDKELNELRWTIEKVNIDDSQKNIEKSLKQLADRISRTKTAREFYEKILSQTGDVELAANVTFSIYGENGEGLQKEMDEYVAKLFGDYKITIPKIQGTDKIDYLRVKQLAKEALDAKQIGEEAYKDIVKIAEDGQKDLSKIAEQGAKLLLTYDEIAQKRVNIEQDASDKIRQLREAEALYLASNATEEQKQAYSNRTNKAVKGVESKRDLDLLKLKDEYLRFFSAIHSLTRKEADKLRGEVRQALFKGFQDGAISADELKRELNAIDEQFNKLIKGQGKFVSYLDGGFDGLISRLRDMSDEMMSVGSEIGKMNSVDQISDGQKSFIDTMLKQFGNDQTGNSFASLLQNTNGDLSQMGELLQGVSGEMGAMAEGGMSALAMVDRIIKDVAATIEGIAAIRDQLNELRSEDHQLEGWGWDAFEYLENFNKYAAQGWEDFKNGHIVEAVQSTAQSIISIFNTAHAQKVKRLNKQIKEQERLLEDLEYTYSRLEVAMEKAFGADYINNFKAQQKNLQAQADAYKKQAELERAKGKSADEDKVREYEAAYRDTMDEIADMQGQIAAQMLGTDLTSAARDFAKAWLDAYKEFGNTADAMSEKFHEMIENMVVEGALAKVVENALQPVFDLIDESNEADWSNPMFYKRVAEAAQKAGAEANYGSQVMMNALEQAGLSMRDLGGEFTGVAKQVAGATSEEILANTNALNTQNFYISRIHADVEGILARMGGEVTMPGVGTDYTPLIQQSLANQAQMVRYQAETLAECRRSALAAEETLTQFKRVISVGGAKATNSIQVNINKGL